MRWPFERRIQKDLQQMESRIMATLEELLTDDTDLATQVQALVDAFDAVIAAQAAGTLTPEQQAVVDQADAQLQATKASVVAALAAATPAAPTE